MGIATTLNQTTSRPIYTGVGPFPVQTKEEFLADLRRSDEDIKHGRVKDAYVAVEEVFAKHGY